MNNWVYATSQTCDWHEALNHFSNVDVYFLPEYHRAHERNGDGAARGFFIKDGHHALFYAFLIRPIEQIGSKLIEDPWYDIETVYGYGGPLSTTDDPVFLKRAWELFFDWCQENRIIAEFIRFHPLLDNQRFMMDKSCLVYNRKTVYVDLKGSQKEIWENYPSVHRNMIRKALHRNLVCEEMTLVDGLEIFKDIYKVTMEGVGADRYYFFSDAYFECLKHKFDQNTKLFVVKDDEQIVAAALILTQDEFVHYHLAGSDFNFRKFAPNNLLLHTVIMWAQEKGFHKLHLGGGRTSDSDDSLLRFKSGISRNQSDFYVGKRVINQVVYDKFCELWRQQHPEIREVNYFLLYRMEDGHFQ